MYFLLAFLSLLLSHSFAIVVDRASNLCGTNVTLVGPHVSIRINFDQPFELSKDIPCTSFIQYEPENRSDQYIKDMKLLPYITKTGPNSVLADPKHTVLRITVVSDRLMRLDIFESRSFYLTVTPVIGISYDGQCPNDLFRTCGSGVCLHQHLFCDGTAQCQSDEASCYTIPSENFLIFSFLTVILVFLGISLGLALYLYCKFYQNRTYLLSADFKPQYYGTVNGSLSSRRSFMSSTYASAVDVQNVDGQGDASKTDTFSYFNHIQPSYFPLRK